METCIKDSCIIDLCIIDSCIIDVEVEKEVLVAKDEIKRPEGSSPRSRGPEGPKTSSMIYF